MNEADDEDEEILIAEKESEQSGTNGDTQVKLTPRQLKFVEEYCKDLNGTQAAIRTGYSKKIARVHAHRMITNDNIKKAVSKRFSDILPDKNIVSQKLMETLIEQSFSEKATTKKYKVESKQYKFMYNEEAEDYEYTDCWVEEKAVDKLGSQKLLAQVIGMLSDSEIAVNLPTSFNVNCVYESGGLGASTAIDEATLKELTTM